MEVRPRELQLYLQDDGSSPFDLWLDDLRDNEARSRIRLRLRRVVLGNLGDYKPVGEGVYELRLDYGPGYRVYFGQEGNTIVVLLCGGDKRSQNQDIAQAKNTGQTMKTVKAPTTKPYQDSLMQALRDRTQASAYLQAALEDATTEPELLQAVLQDIHTALGTTPQNITPIATQPLHQAFPALVQWLDELGLTVSIDPK